MNDEPFYSSNDLQKLSVLISLTGEKIIKREDRYGKRFFYLSGDPDIHKNIVQGVFSLREKVNCNPVDIFDTYQVLLREVKNNASK